MIFTERRRDTSWANQIASLAIFDSTLLTIAANPRSILDNPARDVIKAIPAIWDETRVLSGSEIGEAAVYARRTGDAWFLAVMCGPAPKAIRVPLAFLGAGAYQAVLVRDKAGDPAGVELETREFRQTDALNLELAAGGGFVARFATTR
jgi:alpha-glucosidase